MSCSTASIVPTRLISTAIQPSCSSRHMRSTGPMSVGHSRRTSRKPSPHHSGASASALLQVRLHAVLHQAGVEVHRVRGVRQHLGEADVEPVLALELAHDDGPVGSSSIAVGGVIQFSGL